MHYNLLSCLKAFAVMYFIHICLFFKLGETPNNLEGSQKKKHCNFLLCSYTLSKYQRHIIIKNTAYSDDQMKNLTGIDENRREELGGVGALVTACPHKV